MYHDCIIEEKKLFKFLLKDKVRRSGHAHFDFAVNLILGTMVEQILRDAGEATLPRRTDACHGARRTPG